MTQEGQSARKKDAEWLKAHLIRVDPPYNPNRKTSAGLSTASAKPMLIERLKEAEAIFTVYRCDYNLDRRLKIKNAFALAITALESQPAAERVALEKVRALRERLDNWVRQFETANPGSPALRYTRQAWKVVRDEIDFRFPELDAREMTQEEQSTRKKEKVK